jgi:hypothetical protein
MAIDLSAGDRLDFRAVDGTVCFAIARAQGRFREGRSRVTRTQTFQEDVIK